jgi:hypothetical protein
MLRIPPDIKIALDSMLFEKAIPGKVHPQYRKWVRFYLDFCRKYHFDQCNEESLSHFIHKLKEKNQTQQQQKQASDAVSTDKGTLINKYNIILQPPFVSEPSQPLTSLLPHFVRSPPGSPHLSAQIICNFPSCFRHLSPFSIFPKSHLLNQMLFTV